VDPSLCTSLILLTIGVVSSNDVSVSLYDLGARPGRRYLLLPFAGARGSVSTPPAGGGICPENLHAMGWIAPLQHCNVIVIQRWHRLQQ
jgi:hypothetical protein